MSIDFFRNILEDPSIWQDDLIGFDPNPEKGEQLEEFVRHYIFNEERIGQMLRVMCDQYIILTEEEVELWKENSLEFFIS
jgi:hypothetical protein